MPDPVARILERLTVTHADGTPADDPLRLILDEEGPEALVQAVLDADAADTEPTDAR